MPCSDVTEYLTLSLTSDDLIADFTLQKNTCGAPVGNFLLLKYIQHSSVTSLQNHPLTHFVPNWATARQLDQFLLTKQFAALQKALAVYCGAASGQTGEPFVVERIDYQPNGITVLHGLLTVNMPVDDIRACGNCGCTSNKN